MTTARSARVPGLSLKERLERIGQHIVRARLFLDMWFYFEEDRSRQEIIETMREYNEFFRFTPHAYFVAYVVYIAGVFEPRKDTISLIALVREMNAAGQLSREDEATVNALLSSAKLIAKKVAILRNNALAHRTVGMSYDDVFNLAAVEPSELRDVTDMALRVANHLLLSCGLQDQHFTDLPREAAVKMMTALATR